MKNKKLKKNESNEVIGGCARAILMNNRYNLHIVGGIRNDLHFFFNLFTHLAIRISLLHTHCMIYIDPLLIIIVLLVNLMVIYL